MKWEVSNWSEIHIRSEKQSESAKWIEVWNAKWIKNKPIKHKSIPMSNQSATELRRQLTLQKVNPELHDRIINFPIHLRGDLLQTYNDVTLRYTVKKVLKIYLPENGKEADNIMNNLLPPHWKLKYSDSEEHTSHYKGNNK